jgi:hypothetical protein
MLTGCTSLRALPESTGDLQQLQQLHLCRCSSLTSLPYSCAKLVLHDAALGVQGSLALLCLRGSGLRPLPEGQWPVQQQIQSVLRMRHLRESVVYRLSQDQDAMLATLERMSWVVVLLATATFIAFLQPPGGYGNDHQVRHRIYSQCHNVNVARAKRGRRLMGAFGP